MPRPFTDKSVDALGHHVTIDGWCTVCECWHPDTAIEVRVEYPPDPMWGLRNLPISLFDQITRDLGDGQ